MAYEAADCGLLSPDLAAGIRRVKGVKKLGVRLGNWLTPEQSQRLWQAPGDGQLPAILAVYDFQLFRISSRAHSPKARKTT